MAKLKSYGADGKTTDLMHGYLSNRRQRVRLGDQFSTRKGGSTRQRAWPLIFDIFLNDLVYAVKQSRLSAYADDTQIVFADSTAEKVEEAINADLANVDQWYKQKGMKRNTRKYQAVVMGNAKVMVKSYGKCHGSTAKTLLFPLPKISKCLVLPLTTQ